MPITKNMFTMKNKTRGNIQLTIVAFIILFLHIGSQMIFFNNESKQLQIVFTCIFNFFSFFVYAYFLMIVMNNGHVDDGKSNEYLLTKLMQFKKFCYRCRTHRPERSHHCSKCDRCIKKMDHHCFWLGRCINNDNMSHFIRFLFFAILSILILVVYASVLTVEAMQKTINFFIIIKICIIAFSIFLIFILSMFLLYALRNVLKNVTSIEKEMCDNLIRCGKVPEHNPYDRGKWNNFVEVMGKPGFLFLFGETGDGLSFTKTYAIDGWPPVRREINDIEMKNGEVIDVSIV